MILRVASPVFHRSPIIIAADVPDALVPDHILHVEVFGVVDRVLCDPVALGFAFVVERDHEVNREPGGVPVGVAAAAVAVAADVAGIVVSHGRNHSSRFEHMRLDWSETFLKLAVDGVV